MNDKITDEQIMSALREVVAESPDRVYAAPAHMRPAVDDDGSPVGETCFYVHVDPDGSNQRRGCVGGAALNRLGVPLGELTPWEGRDVDWVMAALDLGSPAIRLGVLAAQKVQDRGKSWGEALAAAETEWRKHA